MKLINLKKYLLIILRSLFIVLLFWNRLLRERLPKDIPFNLSWKLFLILLIGVGIHLYIIYNIIQKYLKPTISQLNFDQIYLPLILLDTFIKEKFLLEKRTYKLILMLLKYSVKSNNYSKIIYFAWHIIQIILPIILCIDIFYLKRISLFYQMLGLLLFPLIYKYLRYSLNTYYNQQCQILDQHIAIQWDNPPSDLIPEGEDHVIIPTNMYIEKTVFKKPNEIFLTSFSLYFHYMASLNKRLVSDPSKFRLDFNKILATEKRVFYTLQNLYNILCHYNSIDQLWKPWINFIKSTLYVICWSYILFVSYASLYYASFESLWIIQEHEDPFSLTECFQTKESADTVSYNFDENIN